MKIKGIKEAIDGLLADEENEALRRKFEENVNEFYNLKKSMKVVVGFEEPMALKELKLVLEGLEARPRPRNDPQFCIKLLSSVS